MAEESTKAFRDWPLVPDVPPHRLLQGEVTREITEEGLVMFSGSRGGVLVVSLEAEKQLREAQAELERASRIDVDRVNERFEQ